ncbi:MAG: OmpA family protein [Cytophaga sp.]|uniref:OmpA family protein n=1 Tax=Cytophaga sp. TaxID=29535 RepID=UPI003F7D6358
MRIFICIYFFCCCTFLQAQQEVRWACKVLETNDKNNGALKYSPQHALGVPKIYPAYGAGMSANNWIIGYNSSGYKSSNVTLKVGFCDPIIAEQVVIVESYNPGAITSVTIVEQSGATEKVYTAVSKPLTEKNRVLSIPIKKCKSPVIAVLITASNMESTNWNYIDAIGIASTAEPVNLTVNVSTDAALTGVSAPLGDAINSRYIEAYPIISADGKLLYFSRLGDPANVLDSTKTDIWYSNKTADGQWSKAQNIGRPLNNEGHNFVSSLTPDVNTLLIANTYNPDGSSDRNGVSISNHSAAGWELPKELMIEGFENSNIYSSFFLAADGKTMLLSIQMQDSYGDLDLYVSFMKTDKTWTKPMNMGKKLNTFQSEATPFLASDGKTLYFGSNGYLGYGGYDIFMTKRLDDTWKNWSTPVNLGPKINSINSELAFSVPASGDVAYTYSVRNAEYNSDIFMVSLAPSAKPDPVTIISGRVLDAKTGNPIGAEIEYDILSTGVNVGVANSNAVTGDYKIVLPAGNTYAYRAKVPGYLSLSENISIEAASGYTETHVDLMLVPIETGQKLELKNVFFYQSSDKLIETSYSELDRIAEVMKLNPAVKIELDGHTDNQGDAALNMELSRKRVVTVKNYLISKGIDSTRISTKAFGGTKPIAPNDTEENKKKNRRVEVIIVAH